MKRVSAVLAVSAIFVAGLLAGVAGTHLFYSNRMASVGGPRGWMVDRFEERLQRDLELTPAQVTEIRRIVDESRRASEQLRRDVFPQVREVVESAAEEISAVLTPEQRRRFDAFRDRRLELYLMGPGRPGPHGRHPFRRHGRPGRP